MTGLPGGTEIRNVGSSFLNSSALAVVCNGGMGYIREASVWRAFGPLPGQAGSLISLSSIAFDPRDDRTLFMGSVALDPDAHHLWKTQNGGLTWTAADGNSAASNGLPFGIPVHLVQVDRLDSRVVFAGTDFGLYRSVDAGATWSRYGEGLPWVAVRDLFEAEDGSFLRVATYGRGVWELPLAFSVQSLRVSPATVTLKAGQSQAFSASVTGSGELLSFSNWRSTGGRITSRGIFTGTLPGQFSVIATSLLDPSRSDAASVTVTAQPDLNVDGRVDVLDLAELAKSFGTHPGNAGYVYLSDQNGDGEIDDLDVGLWLGAFGN